MEEWFRNWLRFGHQIVNMPTMVESDAHATSLAFQRLLAEIVYGLHVLETVLIVVGIIATIFKAYSWNLRRREVIADEQDALAQAAQAAAIRKQALATARLAEAMERIALHLSRP